MSFCKKKERKLAHCLELRIVGSMKKILLIYTDSLVLNIPRSGNILTAHPGYLYLTVLQNAISGINFYTLKTLKLLINDLAKTSAPAGGT